MQWFAGTSGFSYDAWRGPFFPENLPKKDWLGFYASKLPAVEINNTFYRMPKARVVEAWRDAVPDGFKFVIKASKRITHIAKLEGAEEPMAFLVANTERLEDRLGALLFQTPPYLRADPERLARFLDLIPEGVPAAFEFRHRSWLEAAVFERLAERGHALVAMDEAEHPAPVCAGAWCYLRLRKSSYSPAELGAWHQRVREASPPLALAFFKHEDDGTAPALARRFLDLAEAPRPRRADRRSADAERASSL